MWQYITEPLIVEQCRTLTIGAIKRDLRRCRRKEPNVTGQIKFKHGSRWQTWNYWFEYADRKTYLVISHSDHYDLQRILLSEHSMTFGSRNYFICYQCGRQANNLYMPQRTVVFRCRTCCRLKYELQLINRGSTQGKLLYRTSRTIKLVNQRVDMNRIIYQSQYTKRYTRFLKLCERAGLHTLVRDAEDLMTAIKA